MIEEHNTIYWCRKSETITEYEVFDSLTPQRKTNMYPAFQAEWPEWPCPWWSSCSSWPEASSTSSPWWPPPWPANGWRTLSGEKASTKWVYTGFKEKWCASAAGGGADGSFFLLDMLHVQLMYFQSKWFQIWIFMGKRRNDWIIVLLFLVNVPEDKVSDLPGLCNSVFS